MRAATRAGDGYVLVAMLAAGAAGRLLDAAALLPGVHEARSVRGGGQAWLTALVLAAVVAGAAAARWSRTHSLAAVARVVVPGQIAVFFAAEAVVRVANGRGAIDPDGLIGACLQAGLALLLLLVLTAAWAVAVQCRPPAVSCRTLPRSGAARHHRSFLPTIRPLLLLARGPPGTACT